MLELGLHALITMMSKTSGIPHMGSRSITMDSVELVRVIQDGIAMGILYSGNNKVHLNTSFTPKVLSYPQQNRFKYHRVKDYDETTDPINHLKYT